MEIWSADQIQKTISGLIHPPKQIHGEGIDLTVKELSKFSGPGALDFGGSEYKPATLERIMPEKQKPEDEYGWWNLNSGDYLIKYNELINFPEGTAGIIFPHLRLIQGGGSHPACVIYSVDEQSSILLQVGSQGLLIKENARVSTLIILG